MSEKLKTYLDSLFDSYKGGKDINDRAIAIDKLTTMCYYIAVLSDTEY